MMRELILRMEEGAADNPRIGELMTHLADRLRFTSGKKQYGYLKAPLKSVVDEIVDELARDPRVAQAYELWYEMREEVLRTYKNDLPERLPLSRQKEFKSIKNMVIREAVRLGELRQVFHPEDHGEDALPEQEGDGPQPEPGAVWEEEPPPDSGEPRASWKQAYRRARAILKDPNAAPEQMAQAVELLTQAAEHGNSSAAFTLGQLYLSGTALPRDPAAAVRWLERAAESGNQYAQYRLGKLLLQGEDVPKDVEAAVRWLTASAEQGSQYAQYALGKLYLMGEEIPEDREAARQWFQRAAEQGNQYAQYFCGAHGPPGSFSRRAVGRPAAPPPCRDLPGAEPAAPPRRAAANRGQKALAGRSGKRRSPWATSRTIMKNQPSRCNGGHVVKKKYTSTNLLPQKAGSPSVQLRPQRKGAILRQIPYHRKTRKRRR